MRWVLACLLGTVLVVSAAGVAQAHPPAPVDSHGRDIHGKLHRWLHQSRAPLFRGRIRILRRACPTNPDVGGCINSLRPRRMYLHPRVRHPRGVFYHELGHAFDLLVLNNGDRRAFKRLIGVRRGWYSGDPRPAELFADGYAACSFHSRLRRSLARTAYGYRATPRRHERVCALLRRAAAPRGKRPQRPSQVPPVAEKPPPAKHPSQAPGQQPQQPKPCSLTKQLLGGC